MSEYADIRIKGLSLFSFRNYLIGDIVSLFFTKDDLIVTPNCKIDLEDEELDEGYIQYLYKTTVRKAKERLDALGFCITNFEKVFNEKKLDAIDYDSFLYHSRVDFEDGEEESQKRIQKRITFKKWKNAMHKIIS